MVNVKQTRKTALAAYSDIRHDSPAVMERWKRKRINIGAVSSSQPNWLKRYDRMGNAAAGTVIGAYSTSFSLSSRLLPRRERRDIRNLYAVARIADEIVDGTAEQAGVGDPEAVLDAYEQQVLSAPHIRFHTDPIIHAYAETARRCGFDPEYLKAFFTSMRRDLHQSTYTDTEFADYVYGSAEVIGLLCLSVFLAGKNVTDADRQEMEYGARRLGAAFQKINFLRDIGEDKGELGRAYFPGLNPAHITDENKTALIADIRDDIAAAQQAIELLPFQVRAAVLAAAGLFEELADMIDATPAQKLARSRVRVPEHRKVRLTLRAVKQAACAHTGATS